MSQKYINLVLEKARCLVSSPDAFWSNVVTLPEASHLTEAERTALRSLPLAEVARFVATADRRRANAIRGLNVT